MLTVFDCFSLPRDDEQPDSTFLTQATVEVSEVTTAWTEKETIST